MILESLTMWWLLPADAPSSLHHMARSLYTVILQLPLTVTDNGEPFKCFGFCSFRNQFSKHAMYYITWKRRVVCIRSRDFYSARGDSFANGYYVEDPCHKATPSGTTSSANLGFATTLYDTRQVQSYSTKHFISVWKLLYTDIIFSSHCRNSWMYTLWWRLHGVHRGFW